MSSTLLPFLYQTRTLRRALRASGAVSFARLVHSPRRTARNRAQDNAIPFAWDPSEPHASTQTSTITPSEAQVFKSIFDEIAQGKIPSAKKRPSKATATAPGHASGSTDGGARAAADNMTVDADGQVSELWSNQDMAGRSPTEQARVTEFREKVLRRFPQSLRNAAQVALGLFELKPDSAAEEEDARPRLVEMDGGNQRKWMENTKYDEERSQEFQRVESLMKACVTDDELWRVFELEVLLLPEKLGILETSEPESTNVQEDQKDQEDPEEMTTTAATGVEQSAPIDEIEGNEPLVTESEEQRRIMDIHGPLYSQYISMALGLFETAFARPSPFVFDILPHVRGLGLPSYVLGMSTPFYCRLAQIHWERFGDASSAIDVLLEMNAVGLHADRDVRVLLKTIREQLIGCAWGSQGPFVMAMTEYSPYDSALMQKLEAFEETVRRSLQDRALI